MTNETSQITVDINYWERVHFHSYGDGYIRLITDRGYMFDVTCPTQKHPPIDVEALKREICETVTHNIQKVGAIYAANVVSDIVDHLASAGYLRAPLPRIDGLEEAIKARVPYDKQSQLIYRAARAYLKASGV